MGFVYHYMLFKDRGTVIPNHPGHSLLSPLHPPNSIYSPIRFPYLMKIIDPALCEHRVVQYQNLVGGGGNNV